ncbi:hypothetical protein MMC13_007219 [Lambiella insularis]|nr:hypothetical protein [Lambiella insularis]
MAPSAFTRPPQPPPVFVGTSTSIVEDTERIIQMSRKLQDRIVADVKLGQASFKDVVLPLAYDEANASLESHILGFYQAVSSDKALRDASTEADKLLDNFSIESNMREDVYKLVDTVFNKKERLDAESQRLLEKTRKDYIRNGLSLPAGAKRDRYKEIKKRLSQISIQFQKNLNEENGGLWFTKMELDGVPEDVLSTLTKGDKENEGKLRLTFKYPDLFPTLKYAKNAVVRQKVFIDNENKCNLNTPLFKEAVLLRDEGARLLGYPDHAAFRIEDKMAKTPATVDEFLGDLRHRLTSGGAKERDILKEIKKEDLESRGEKRFDGNYFVWDHRYYSRIQLERDYKLDQQKVAEYFPLQTTLSSMLRIFEELMGLVFVEITTDDRSTISPTSNGDDIVWHPDVQIFSVWNDEGEGGEFVGYLYTDLHPRDGKYGHAANFNISPGFINPNGTRRYPATALVCNFSKPSPQKPSLLKHEEVVTLFHELGHGIHDLVSRTTYARFHGTNVVQDFVEAPSQMLENWCWTPSQLKALSKHYSTLSPEYLAAWKSQAAAGQSHPSEKIPDDLIDNLIKTKHVNDALFTLRQLHFGIFDMAVHEPKSHEELEKTDCTELFNVLRTQISGLDGPEVLGMGNDWGHGQATFGHLIGGYDAGYYGYLSSQVYSMDMFYSVFAKDPMNAKEGRRYRHAVLEKGGSQDEMKSLEDFLGRKPSSDAFYRELGLK